MALRRTSSSSAPQRRNSLTRTVAFVLAALLVGSGLGLHPSTASAAQAGWARIDTLSGSSRDYTTVMRQRPAGFPEANVSTNSVGGSAVGVQSGSGTFLAPNTPVGEKYGSSRGEAYLNLRPNGLSTAPPSVTTYTFARPTPATGWTFVLGDIDADAVTIAATDENNQPVSAADLGFRSVFNYCAPGVSPKPNCAPPNNDGSDLPTWLSNSSTLRGNTGALDTAGASAWFEPRVAISTLSFTYAQRSGSPVYQTWFSALSHNLTGTIDVPASLSTPVTVKLYDPEGNIVGTTETDADGTYAFPGRATYDGYRVEVEPPTGYTSDTPLSRRVDLGTADQTADFALREIVPVSVGGTVTVGSGSDPAAGVTVKLYDTDGSTVIATATTDVHGNYVFDGVEPGDGYSVRVTVPEGYTATTTRRDFDVPTGSETPITGKNFALAPIPTGTISGQVRNDDTGDPIGGVGIVATSGTGEVYEVATDADGGYDLTGLPPGTYRVAVTPPNTETSVVGAAVRTVIIPDAGGTFDNRDFRLLLPVPAPTYAISGSVTDADGQAVAGATVVVEPPGGGEPLVTEPDADGAFAVPGLPTGDNYEVSVLPPSGYVVEPPRTQSVDVDNADVGSVDFTLTPKASEPSASPSSSPSVSSSPSPTSSSTTVPSATSSSSPVGGVSSGGLADTGGPSALWLMIGVGAVLLGAICLIAARLRTTGSRR